MRIGTITAMIIVLAGCGNRTSSLNEPSCLSKIPNPVFVKSADVRIGSDNTYPEESPARTESIARFEIDATEVTNAQFAEFVKVTNYVTSAENVQPGFDKPGAAVSTLPSATQPNWWQFVEGADWRHPEGPESSIKGRERDPVVQVSHIDAKAYAKWAGRRLPSEAEWEYAASTGADTLYPWGDELRPDGKEQANTWQGAFPIKNTEKDGYFLRAPVGCYPANDFGLYDMIGNVWEWTDTVYEEREGEQVYAIKGGSFLCAENYCRRYRAPARQPQEAGFSTNHIGFRTVKTVN
jgi:formylglycine-generating enzyme required for sulfatase activity